MWRDGNAPAGGSPGRGGFELEKNICELRIDVFGRGGGGGSAWGKEKGDIFWGWVGFARDSCGCVASVDVVGLSAFDCSRARFCAILASFLAAYASFSFSRTQAQKETSPFLLLGDRLTSYNRHGADLLRLLVCLFAFLTYLAAEGEDRLGRCRGQGQARGDVAARVEDATGAVFLQRLSQNKSYF